MSFYDDLKFGQDSERLLVEKYQFLEHTTGRKSDFMIKGTNLHIELKTDSYDMHKYGNIIIERYGSDEKDGGPFSALKNGCKYFIYMFVKNDKIFVFETVRLVARIKKLVKKHDLKLHEKWNPGYITRYYKVPINMLEDLDVTMAKLKRDYEVAAAKVKKKAIKHGK